MQRRSASLASVICYTNVLTRVSSITLAAFVAHGLFVLSWRKAISEKKGKVSHRPKSIEDTAQVPELPPQCPAF